jgi:hypothetical protein
MAWAAVRVADRRGPLGGGAWAAEDASGSRPDPSVSLELLAEEAEDPDDGAPRPAWVDERS